MLPASILKKSKQLTLPLSILALVCVFAFWLATFVLVKDEYEKLDNLYHPNVDVSLLTNNIQFNIQTITDTVQNIRSSIHADELTIEAKRVMTLEEKVERDITLVFALHPISIESAKAVEQLIIDWRKSNKIFFELHFGTTNIDSIEHIREQNSNIAYALSVKLYQMFQSIRAETKQLTNKSSATLNRIELFRFFIVLLFLLIVVLTFGHLNRRTNRKNNRVIKALDWTNELLDSSPDAMIITDEIGNIKKVNTSAVKLFGYSKREFITLNVSQLIPKRFSNHQEKTRAFFDNGSSRRMGEGKDLFAVNKIGEEFHVEISLNIAELNAHKVAIASIRDVTRQKKIEAKVLHQARYDFLTQLPNRFLSLDRLENAISRAKRNSSQLAVMYLDLNDFKKANDLFGHQMGDRILVSTAKKLKDLMREVDTVGRIGGDEFFILIDSFASKSGLEKIAAKVLKELEQPLSFNQQEVSTSASIGISIYPEDGDNVEDLLVNADLAMYRSKKQSKNSFTFFECSMRDALNRKSSIEESLKGALKRNEFYLVYQPKYEITSGKVVGFEALLRWKNEKFADVTPDEFIPLIEQIGLINEVGMFVIDSALREIKRCQQDCDSQLHVAINISPLQFNDPSLFEQILVKLHQYKLKGQALEIEITEGLLLEGTIELDKTLSDMKKTGISIALDDFGTGYSSLSYIKDYPINSIKIDKSFIDRIPTNETHSSLVKAIISLAHSLHFNITAEGIENNEQLTFLKNSQCDIAQGYLLSKPIQDPMSVLTEKCLH